MSEAARRFFLVGTLIGITSLAAACGGGESTATAPNSGAAKAAPAATDTTTASGATLAQFTGDASKGAAAFAQCRTCHVTEPGQNRTGPSLHGIVGRPAGEVAGYSYSPANKNSGTTWSPEKLFQFLENPQRVMPGTKMVFAGIADPQRRADLIAWLQTQG